jgi:hypothetical protein
MISASLAQYPGVSFSLSSTGLSGEENLSLISMPWSLPKVDFMQQNKWFRL